MFEVEKNYKNIPGIYNVTVNDDVVYVGETKNLYSRILSHFACTENTFLAQDTEKDKYLKFHEYNNKYHMEIKVICTFPDGTSCADRRQVEKSLIEQYQPPFNKTYTVHTRDYDWYKISQLETKWEAQND